MQSLDNLCANAIRVVSADAIQRANSGHPGMVMGAAPMGYALYSKHMIIDPKLLIGKTVTALCCPPAMAACCCIPCCICLALG